MTHRQIASEMLGRPLAAGEVVHHIDGDHFNNEPGNLMVTTAREHQRIHARKRLSDREPRLPRAKGPVSAKPGVFLALLKENDWTLKEAAEAVGVTRGMVNALLDGEAVGPKTITGALRVFAPLGFDDLFEAGAPAAAQEAAA